MMQTTADAVIVAAGRGKRFGSKLPKQFLTVAGKPVLAWSIAAFQHHPRIQRIVVVGPEEWLTFIATEIVDTYGFDRVSSIVKGGQLRQDSVLAGLSALDSQHGAVLVHDAARPLLSANLIDRVLNGLSEAEACIPGIPVIDTVKAVHDGWVEKTLERDQLRLIQTPQAFSASKLLHVLQQASKQGITGTDEAALIEHFGGRVRCVEGEPTNLKITSQLDLKIVEQLLEERNP